MRAIGGTYPIPSPLPASPKEKQEIKIRETMPITLLIKEQAKG